MKKISDFFIEWAQYCKPVTKFDWIAFFLVAFMVILMIYYTLSFDAKVQDMYGSQEYIQAQ